MRCESLCRKSRLALAMRAWMFIASRFLRARCALARACSSWPRWRGFVIFSPIDADAVLRGAGLSVGNFNHDVQEPVAPGVAREIRAVLDLAFGKGPGVEHAKRVAGKAECVARALEISPLERHPAEGSAAAIAQVRPAMLATRLGVLLANRVDDAGMD